MYSRAPRVLTAKAGSTPSKLGPGAYSPQDSDTHHIGGFAPFSSLAPRETFLDISDTVAMAPGPGYYESHSEGVNIWKRGTPMTSKTKRFEDSSTITPGPGAYNVDKEPATSTLQQLAEYMNTNAPQSRITYSRQPTAPSIPIPGKSYGFEESESGHLIAQEAPRRDTTLGPAYYKVNHEETETTRRYRGVHFGHLKSTRPEFKVVEGPGPADYNPKIEQDQNMMKKSPPASSFNSKVPRYHDDVPMKAKQKNIPGPGQYNFSSQFSSYKKNDKAFGSAAVRFISAHKPVPAPGTYDDPRTAMEATKRLTGMKKSPFGQTSARFKLDRQAIQIPGPGMYNDMAATSMAVQLSKKAVIDSSQKAAFGTRTPRALPLVNRDDSEKPGPAHYHPADDCKTVITWVPENQTATFASSTKRLHEPPTIVKDIPAPGTYDVHDSHSKTQGKISSHRGKASPFLSSASRFAPPCDILQNKPDASIPGPDTYDTDKSSGKHQSGLICCRDNRFKEKPEVSPGPAAYVPSVPYRDTLLKGTFNTTLNNPYRRDVLKSPTKKKQVAADSGHLNPPVTV